MAGKKKKPPSKKQQKGKKSKANTIKKKKEGKKTKTTPHQNQKPSPTTPNSAKPPTPTSQLGKPTGLGKSIDDEIAKSPKFKAKLKSVQNKGYTIKYGVAGKGSYCDKQNKVIVIDPNDKNNPNSVLQTLAHELGHADYEADPYVPLIPNNCQQPVGGAAAKCGANQPFTLTREEYAAKNAERSLKDEGEATLTNIELAEDLRKHGGLTIGVAGSQAAKYKQIAAKYPNAVDRDKARKEIGEVFAKKEHPSTDPTKTYEQYYQAPHEKYYDQEEAKSLATVTSGGQTTNLNPTNEDVEIKPQK